MVTLDQLPPGVTPKQMALARAVVNGAATWSDAMRQAGYAPSSVAGSVSSLVVAPGVQAALQHVRQQTRGSRDKAREIVKIALDKSLTAIESESDVARLLPAAKLASDVASSIEDDGSGPSMSMSPQQQRLLIRRAIVRYARLHGSSRTMPSWLDATVEGM